MSSIIDIINEEIMTTVANYPQFGDRLRSISEVGEGTIPYPFEFDNVSDNEVHYYFSTEGFDYDVILNGDQRSGNWEMQFGAIGGTPSDVTNEGKPIKIMTTLVQITQDFIRRFKPNIIRFRPEKDEEYEGDDKRRFNMYMAYIKKNMIRDYTVYDRGEYIFIKKLIPIIKEEAQRTIDEIVTGADSRIPVYNYHQISEGRFVIDVDEPEKNIHTKFDVTFIPEGNREEKAYSIAFKQQGGEYGQKTGFGVQFRILATITKIVKEQVELHDPNVLTFQPVKEGGEKGNRRMSLYMQYVKGGAGEDFDAFVIGDKVKVNVEKRNPSFPIENGYQDPETIQDIITQLSVYGGYYQTDLHPTDPEYEKFSMTSWGGMVAESNSGGRRSTISVRRFVDWMFSVPDLSYIQGQYEPQPYEVPREPTAPRGEVPIQRVSGGHTATAMVGTFQHFLQTEVYGSPDYEILEPFFETIKSIGDFNELRSRASIGLQAARTTADQERLQEIVRAIDLLKQNYNDYARRYGTSSVDENQVLREVEEQLLELLGE